MYSLSYSIKKNNVWIQLKTEMILTTMTAIQYDDANGDEAAAVQHHQPIEQLATLPPQLEDPHKLVRRSERERITPGKYQDFVMSSSTAVKSSSQFLDTR